MDNSSGYTFPIFISSTDYNLKDLRAELARFLSELGYKPILSSFEGFPDSSPLFEPWESCLPALDQCFIMVLIIDGNYGTALNWPNYSEYFKDDKISPTHGEYIFAHTNRKRMLVFIRENLMPHYQSYRKVMSDCNNDIEEAKKILNPTLPPLVTFDTLQFINIVKTTRPIPWINEFKDITTIKKEIQKKMLNELAKLFLIKNKHAETVIDSFNIVMDTLSIEEQKKALGKINATKQIINAVDKLDKYQNDLSKVESELEQTKTTNTTLRNKQKKQIEDLQNKIDQLENETYSTNSQFFIRNGKVKIGNPNYIDSESFITGSSSSHDSYTNYNNISNGLFFNQLETKKCERCNKNKSSFSLSKCPSCNRNLCDKCWSKNSETPFSFHSENIGILSKNNNICPECANKKE